MLKGAERTMLLALAAPAVAAWVENRLTGTPGVNSPYGQGTYSENLEQFGTKGNFKTRQDYAPPQTWAEQVKTGKDIVGSNFSEVMPTQTSVNRTKVEEYAKILRAGGKLKPVQVVEVPGKGVYILDGHHRFVASQMTGIPVEIKNTKGTGPVGIPQWNGVSGKITLGPVLKTFFTILRALISAQLRCQALI